MITTRRKVQVLTPSIYDELDNPYRYKVLYGGRSAARSWTIARKLLRLGQKRKIHVLCTRELQKSIKQSVHRLLKNQIHMLAMDGFYDVKDTYIRGKNGTEFTFLGVRYNTDEIKSMEGVDIVWIEEGHSLTEESWDIIDPTIRAEGSEIWITFNTRFKFDHVYQLFVDGEPPPDTLVIKSSYLDNPFVTSVIKKQAKTMKERDYEKYLHVYMGELKILAEGAIYGDQFKKARREKRIIDFPITNAQVETFWDLGRNNQTAIWWMQKVGHEYRFIDYYESRLKDIPWYCKVIKGQAPLSFEGDGEKCKITEEVNERRRNYNYRMHYMPHDVKQHMLGMKKSRYKQFEAGGVTPMEVVPQIKLIEEGIEMMRDVFPEIFIHKTNCERGIECIANYRYKYNDEDDTYQNRPAHDWASNGSDAIRQFAQVYSEYVDEDEHDYRDDNDVETGSWMT